MKTLIHFWRDERGSATVVATVLLYTVLVLGAVVGLVTLRDEIVQEFGDLSTALESLDQSFHVEGGGSFTDSTELTDPAGEPAAGISVQGPSVSEGS